MINCCDEISDPTAIHVASRIAQDHDPIEAGSFVESDRIEKSWADEKLVIRSLFSQWSDRFWNQALGIPQPKLVQRRQIIILFIFVIKFLCMKSYNRVLCVSLTTIILTAFSNVFLLHYSLNMDDFLTHHYVGSHYLSMILEPTFGTLFDHLWHATASPSVSVIRPSVGSFSAQLSVTDWWSGHLRSYLFTDVRRKTWQNNGTSDFMTLSKIFCFIGIVICMLRNLIHFTP